MARVRAERLRQREDLAASDSCRKKNGDERASDALTFSDERTFRLFWYFWKEHGRDAEWFGRQTWGQLQAYLRADAFTDAGDEPVTGDPAEFFKAREAAYDG